MSRTIGVDLMREVRRLMILVCAIATVLSFAAAGVSQTNDIVHQVEGRLQTQGGIVAGMRVRLVRRDSLEPVAETISRSDGEFSFTRITDGDYLIETFETDRFEATSTEASLRPRPRRSLYLNVTVEIPLK